jgi:hypothetical protein
VTNTETTASNLVAASASFSTRITSDSSSLSARETRTEATASSLVAASASFSSRVSSIEVVTASLQVASGSFSTRVTQIERTYATTGSNIFTGSQNILGAITASAALINGTLTAQTLVVTTISSSVIYSSGSNRFGDDTSDTQTFTGSVNISGSLTLVGRGTINDLTGSLFGTSSWASGSISASYAYTASSAILASASLVAISASYAFTASSAISASFAVNYLGSGSISTRLTNVETTASNLTTASGSFSTRVTNTETTASNLVAASASFSTRITSDSSSFSSRTTNNEITGSNLVAASASFSTRVSSLEATTASLQAASASFSTRVTNTETTSSNLVAASASFSSRTTNTEITASNLVAASASFSTRITNDSASFSTRVTNTETTASNLVAASASFSTRITNDSASFSTRITSDSSSLSARETRTEATASSLVAASASFSTRTTVLEGASGSFSTRVTQIERTYATTGSNIFTGSQNILGAITASAALINGTLTAQTLVVTTVSSSVIYSSGSNRFGDDTSDIQTFTGSVNISGSLTLNGRATLNNLTGSLFGTSSWSSGSISASYAFTASSAIVASASLIAISSSYAFTASSAINASASLIAVSASFAFTASSAVRASASLIATSASYAFTASSAILASASLIATSASYAYTASSAILASASLIATSASYAFTASSATSASVAQTASFVNPLRQTVTITGSLNISGSTTQVGTNNLFGNTSLSGSLTISGSQGAAPTINIFGDVNQTGYTRFLPVTTNIDTSISASYIYVSGSTNDLYFSQNGNGYSNVTRLRWLEGNLYTGLLNGGLIATQSSTVYRISSGSGIIVNLNASLNDNPYPTIQYLNWGNLSGSISAFTSSYQQVFVGIQSNGTIFAQGTPFSNGQFDTVINVGGVFFQNGSTINAVKTQPSVAYGFEQSQNIFNRAFGPLKLSGYTLAPSGSTTGSLIVGSGTAYAPGSNYAVDPNEPSYTVDNGTNTSKIFRYRQSGSTWVYDTNAGAGYTTIDPANYSDNGVLTAVPGGGSNRQWSIQRVFWFPNSVVKAIVVYYGNAAYATEVEAIANISFESFVEAPNTAANAIYLGAIVVRNNANFTDSTSYKIQPGGLFRQVGGSGGGGSVVTQTLAGLSDVSISGQTNGQPLVYNSTSGKWQNQSTLIATLTGNADTATSASYATSASQAISSSFAVNYLGSGSISTRLTNLETASGSFSTRVTNTETTASNLVAASASFSTRITNDSSSLSARVTRTEATASSLVAASASFSTRTTSLEGASGSFSTRVTQIERTYATTGSNIFTGSQNVLGAITASAALINGTLTAQTLVVTTVSSSVVFSSGSNIFGNSTANTQTMTGSLNVSGSATIIGRITATNITGSLFGTASWAQNFITSSVTSASYAFTASSAINASASLVSVSSSYAYTASSAISSSYALTASYLLGYISPFPFTGSAQITGSLGVTGSFSVSANQGSSVFSSNADTLLITGSLIITGSGASITGSLNVSNGITGSLFGTASQAVSASYAYTASSAISASFAVNYLGSGSISTRLTNLETASGSFSTRVTNTETTSSNLVAASASFSTRITNDSASFSTRITSDSSSLSARETRTEATASNLVTASGSFSTRVTQIERTYATTGSNIFTGSQNILGAITASAALINGTLTAQTLVVTTVSSSVIYSSGSNRFGDDTSDIQTFTGSVNISGSLTLVGRGTINNLTGSLFGTSSWSSGSISASYAYTASSAIVASASLIAVSSSYAFTASSAINASASLIAVSSSYAFTASSAISASNALTASYVPASAVVGLNLSQIATGSVTASVGLTSASFQVVSGSTTFLYVSNSGNVGIGTNSPTGGLEVYNKTARFWHGGTSTYTEFNNNNELNTYTAAGSAAQLFINYNGASVNISRGRLIVGGTGAIVSGSLYVSSSVTASVFSGSFTGSLFGTASWAQNAVTSSYILNAVSASYAFTASSATNAFSSSFALTASFVNPLRQNVIISGSLTVSASATALSIQGSGSNVFTVDGTSGRLFEIDDSLSGSLFSVNTAAGLPVIEAFSDNTVRIGQFGQRALFVSQSRVGIGTETPTTNLDVSGSGRFTNGLSLTGSVNSLNGYTGSLFGTASWARNAITASYALGGDASAILYQTASAAFTWSFNHFLQTQYPVFTIYDNTNSVIVPQRIQAVDTSSALIYFSSPTTGIAVASKGGYSSSVVTSATIANTAITASFALSGTGTFSGSFSGSYQGNFSGSLVGTASQAVSASYAATSSFANNFTVANTLTAQTIVVSTISSSVVYSSGSNIFGNSLSNTQTFTGSINATGSTHTIYGNVGIGATGSTAYNLDLSGSMRLTNNLVIQSRGAIKSGIISHDGTNLSINYGISNQSLLVGSLASPWNTMIFAAGNSASSSYAFYAGGTGSLFITNSGSVYISRSLGVSGGITGSLFGTSSQATSASYAFTASSAISSSFALTASYLLGYASSFPYTGSAQITGSLGVTGSFSVSAGAGSSVFSSNADTLLITGSLIITGSGASITGSLNVSNGITGSLFGTASQAQTASFVLNAVSSSYAFTASSATSASYAFTASSATNATNALSASNFTITSTLNFDGTLTDYNAIASTIVGTNNVFAQSTGSYRSGFFKYTAINGTNARTGEVMVAWNGANIVFTDFATTDIGATNDVTMSAALAAGTVQFNAITQGSGWNIRSIGTYM